MYCCVCGTSQPVSNFGSSQRKKSAYIRRCKKHNVAAQRAERIQTEHKTGKLYCTGCCEYHDPERFDECYRNIDGLARWCKTVLDKTVLDEPTKSDKEVYRVEVSARDYADYVDNGRGWWKAKTFAAEYYDLMYGEEE